MHCTNLLSAQLSLQSTRRASTPGSSSDGAGSPAPAEPTERAETADAEQAGAMTVVVTGAAKPTQNLEGLLTRDWLQSCGCQVSAPTALRDFELVSDLALLCSESEDLIFLGVNEAEAEILWRSIRDDVLQ